MIGHGIKVKTANLTFGGIEFCLYYQMKYVIKEVCPIGRKLNILKPDIGCFFS